MTWDGSGTHNRIHNFSADASAGIQAQAVRFDAEFDDVSTALENCQTLTGETTPTANSPMGGFKHTAVAAATSTDNYLRSDQASNQVGIFVRDVNTGVSGTMSASAAVFPAAFSEGQRVTVKVSASGSTSAPRSIIINGLSANIIDSQGAAIPASRMQKDGYFDLVYDASASAFRSISPLTNATGSFTGSLTGFSGADLTETYFYSISGSIVTLVLTTGSLGTSDATAMQLQGLPDAIHPSREQRVPCWEVTDNGVSRILSLAEVGTSGSIIFLLGAVSGTNYTTGSFTASGSKGLTADWTIQYDLNV